MKIMDLVLPCFNEEETLPNFFSEFEKLKQRISDRYIVRLIIVNNGSTDGTREILKNYVIAKKKNRSSDLALHEVLVIELSRNFGKEASLSAGINKSKGDVCIPVDADLQDPLHVVDELIIKWEQTKANVILPIRRYHADHSRYRKMLSKLYVRIFNLLTDMKMEESVGEFRLMDSKVVSTFNTLPENQRFVRGLFSWMGFKVEKIEYIRLSRGQGQSSFNFWKLLRLGMEGITSFSVAPLRFATVFGVATSLISFIYGVTIFFLSLVGRIKLPGYSSILVSILFLGGLQLICLGVIGEYLGKTLLEAKRRPLYLVLDEWSTNG
jgi:polyisoprenyl-phosphate glycosyltransferase